MNTDELTALMKLVQKSQLESLLTAMDCQERIFALARGRSDGKLWIIASVC
jgi:hypothetical protein